MATFSQRWLPAGFKLLLHSTEANINQLFYTGVTNAVLQLGEMRETDIPVQQPNVSLSVKYKNAV